jgi:GTPase SAR1 family protein
MNSVEDLWMKIEKQSINSNLNKENTIETTLLIVGEPSCGKSSLIQSFLRPTVTKEPKSTIALEYNYAKKKTASVSNVNQNTTSLCHIWELGGEVNESKLLEIPLNKSTLSSSSILIVCDLSKPQNILSSLQKWIKATRELVKKQINEYRLANNNTKFSSKILSQSITASAYQDHPKDSNRTRPCEVPIYIVLNKYDLFKTTPATDKRAVYQAVRMFAHYHGAHIITTSVIETSLKESFRSHMNIICFPSPTPSPVIANINTNANVSASVNTEIDAMTASVSANKDAAATAAVGGAGKKTYYDVNIEKPVQVTAGRDDFDAILLMSLTSSSASGAGRAAASTSNTLDDAKVAKSRLLTAESDISSFLTTQGVSTDCWNKFNEHVRSSTTLLCCYTLFYFTAFY